MAAREIRMSDAASSARRVERISQAVVVVATVWFTLAVS